MIVDPVTIRPDRPVREALLVMETYHISGVPVVDEDGHPVAYVELEGELFERRPLKLGTRQGDRVQVVEGLKTGDRVVTLGAYNIRLQAASGAVPAHGHAH
ncbi:MAG: CBS domain-containing protein [Thermoanaerobaculia bacterium]